MFEFSESTPLKEMKRQLGVHESVFRDVANFVIFNQIAGDYFEFGVYRGDSLNLFRHWLSVQWEEFKSIPKDQPITVDYDPKFLDQKRFFAFDSFCGLPNSTDLATPVHFSKGAYAASLEEFVQNVFRPDGSMPVVPVPGWFEDTLTIEVKNKYSLSKAAVIFIDCDLKESAELIFPFVTDFIQDGTVLIIDDWFRYNGHPYKGLQGAFHQWHSSIPGLHYAELCRSGGNRIAFVLHWIK